jgi:hypothetical protein
MKKQMKCAGSRSLWNGCFLPLFCGLVLSACVTKNRVRKKEEGGLGRVLWQSGSNETYNASGQPESLMKIINPQNPLDQVGP